MSTTLLSCTPNAMTQVALFGGKTPSGIRIATMKAESEAVDVLKVHGLELRETERPCLFAMCSCLSEAGQALIR